MEGEATPLTEVGSRARRRPGDVFRPGPLPPPTHSIRRRAEFGESGTLDYNSNYSIVTRW